MELTPQVEHKIKSSILLSDLQKTDKIITGQDVKTRMQNTTGHGYAPAWTERVGLQPQITFSSSHWPDTFTLENIVAIMGLNYHEVCHVEYTLPMTSVFDEVRDRWVRKFFNFGYLNMLLNILEDQRIETLFSKRYANVVPYFTSTVTRYIMERVDKAHNPEETFANKHLLVYGRKYLDPELRAATRNAARNVWGARALRVIEHNIARYVAQGERVQVKTVDETVTAIAKVLSEIDELGDVVNDGDACTNSSKMDSSGERNAKQDLDNKVASPTDPGTDEDEGEGEGEEGEAGEGNSQNGQATEASDSEEAESGSGSGDGEDEGGEGSDDGQSASGMTDEQTEAQDSAAHVKGAGTGEPSLSQEDMEDMLQSINNEALGSQTVQTDYENQMRSVRTMKNNKLQMLEVAPHFRQVTPVTEHRATVRKLAAKWRQIITEEDPGRLTHQSSGTVNMGRAIRGNDLDTVFDTWTEGQQDASSIEVVVLVDTSDSMRGEQAEFAFAALWTLQRAANITSRNINVSAIRYSGGLASYIMPRGQRADANHITTVGVSGGTEPTSALNEAAAIFATSTRDKKILITLTDGMWANAPESNKVVEQIRNAGVVTGLAYIPDLGYYRGVTKITEDNIVKSSLLLENFKKNSGLSDKEFQDVMLWHKHEVRGAVTNYQELVSFTDGLVKRTLKKKV